LLDPAAGLDRKALEEAGMTVILHALPYDVSAGGFYFENIEDYRSLAAKAVNADSYPVEEFEIQFIDGDPIDAELAKAFKLNQSNISVYLEAVAEWSEDKKIRFIISAGEFGLSFDPSSGSVNDIDLDIYEIGSLRELAEQFVEEGGFGEIPKPLESYIDFDAIARDLAVDYAEKMIGEKKFVFRIS
jgi:antirestriction protein